MIDEAELFYKIESKQFELDYNNSFDKDIREYSKTKESENLEIDNSIMLGKEWD